MIQIRNSPECEKCPVAWACCGGGLTPCMCFDRETKLCASYGARPNSCKSSYCQHMKIYTDGTLQDLMINEIKLLEEHACEVCGGASVNIIIDANVAHYYCAACTPE